MNAKLNTSQRLALSIVLVIFLILSLCATTFALTYVSVEVRENRFHTGDVAINLNDGKAVIDASNPDEQFRLFEPGMTVKKDFFVENLSTDSIYYRIFFDDIKGYLSTILEITIMDGDKVICTGTPANLTQNKVPVAGELALNQRRDLTILFHYPESAGNDCMNADLSFTLCAEAVQTRNNDPKNPFS